MKKLVSMVVGLAAAAAFAVPMPEVQVLSFSVTGAETYADDSALADGECFALVWSADGVFEGIDVNGKPKDANDDVVLIDTIAKDRAVTFQFPDGFKDGGFFDIWILDTRVLENGEVKSVGKTVDNQVTVTHAAKSVSAIAVKASQSDLTAPTVAKGAEGVVVKNATVAEADVKAPTITGISFENGLVKISLDNVVKGVNYVIMGSDSPAMTNPKEGFITSAVGEKMTLIAPKFGNFYKAKALVK